MRWMGLIIGMMFSVMVWSMPAMVHFDPVSPIVFWVTSIYCMSIIGQYFAKSIKQPSVLGELLAGILFGNICYYFKVPEVLILREGSSIFEIMPEVMSGNGLIASLKTHVHDLADYQALLRILKSAKGSEFLSIAYVLDVFSRYGLIYLLFMVGLETSWHDLRSNGKPAFMVAFLGVIAPVALGFIVLHFFYPLYSFHTNVFVAATLSATSVGITARVLKDLGKLRTKEARIILGAAMVDDVLGLFILAVVSSLVLQGQMSVFFIFQIIASTLLFFVLSMLLGPQIIKRTMRFLKFLEFWEAKFVIAFVFVMLMSWLASLLQLSSIIGAFTAGLILRDELFLDSHEKPISETKIKDLMAPIQFLLTPLFFFLMGVQVKLENFFDPQVLFLAVLLSLVAIVGKVLGGIVSGKNTNRLFIGIGMMPRGEVGLIFASMGRSLGVVSDNMFSSIVVMVVVTTVLAPIWMRFSLKNEEKLA